jgi:RimJ/RimL family protein N-acetyltransferase
LVLRPFTEADAENLLALESDPEVLRYVWRKPLADAEAYRQFILSTLLPWYDRSDAYGTWAVLEKASQEFVGVGTLKPAIESRRAVEMGYRAGEVELGYGLRRAFWGRGYATEMARALVRRAFGELGATAVVAAVSIGNAASIRVLEKAGLVTTGKLYTLAGEEEPSVKYVLTGRQFEGAHG